MIFAACAAVSGTSTAPPGRRAVSFTFAADYVGGPDVGWVQTEYLHGQVEPSIRRDLTVQAAVAISGAAVASAMGRMASPMQRLLALANVRLGSWLPNPVHLAELARARRDNDELWVPRMPRVRRLKYQFREFLGAFGGGDTRLLLCTDGGHYDNLGLVEMLRLGCRTIFVVDGTADSPPLADTLGHAITLAREELGVTITFPRDELLALVPGSAANLKPEDPLAALNARLSASCVAVGKIRYPEPLTFPDGTTFQDGTLVFAKSALTPDMPYSLLAYALDETTFPRQSTADQWFNHLQFDAYHELGTYLAEQAAGAYRRGLLKVD